ncbi:MAG: hypothetical protein VB021_07210 [Oscillospiraceae bacterium]|nr:hypothetical protein [Oscillospiraceae bacterium]
MNVLEKIREAEKEAAAVRQQGAADARDYAREALAEQTKQTQALLAAAKTDADALREKAGADAKLEADAFIDQAAKADAQLVREASGRLGDACARIVQEVRGL